MQISHDLPSRKSIRIKDYDYSKEGIYFITICTQHRENILSEIVQDMRKTKIELKPFGKIVDDNYNLIIKKYNMKSHNYVIMPNHIHALVEIYNRNNTKHINTIPNIIKELKSITSVEYIKRTKTNEFKNFSKRVWQRNYYEHIVRNEKEYYIIYQYIENNPYNWKKDIYSKQ